MRRAHGPQPASARHAALLAYAAGENLAEVGDRLTVPPSTVHAWTIAAGINRSRAEVNRQREPVRRLQVLALLPEGLSARQIAARLGMNIGTVKEHKRRLRRSR